MRLTMSTRNLAGVTANLFAADARAHKAIRRVVRRNGDKTRDVARSLAPVDTGFLRDNLKARYTENKLGYEVGWDEDDFTSAGLDFYPIFTEFGTVKMPAQPCLFPANEQVRPLFKQELREELRAAIRRKGAA